MSVTENKGSFFNPKKEVSRETTHRHSHSLILPQGTRSVVGINHKSSQKQRINQKQTHNSTCTSHSFISPCTRTWRVRLSAAVDGHLRILDGIGKFFVRLRRGDDRRRQRFLRNDRLLVLDQRRLFLLQRRHSLVFRRDGARSGSRRGRTSRRRLGRRSSLREPRHLWRRVLHHLLLAATKQTKCVWFLYEMWT